MTKRIHCIVLCTACAAITLWSGCSSTSPVLLQLPGERAGTAEIPLKVGIARAVKSGQQTLTDISTCFLLNCTTMHAKMPRRDEVDYLGKSIGDYLRDTKIFSYCYDEPFDRNDIDVILRPRFNNVRLHNSGYGTFMNSWATIPYLGFPVQVAMLLGLPQELFRARYNISISLETPTGYEIALYDVHVYMKNAVNIYKQPYGNYMWYNSVFQKAFFSAMDQFVAQLRRDRNMILRAASGNREARDYRPTLPVRQVEEPVVRDPVSSSYQRRSSDPAVPASQPPARRSVDPDAPVAW